MIRDFFYKNNNLWDIIKSYNKWHIDKSHIEWPEQCVTMDLGYTRISLSLCDDAMSSSLGFNEPVMLCNAIKRNRYNFCETEINRGYEMIMIIVFVLHHYGMYDYIHKIEDILGLAKEDKLVIQSDITDILCKAIDFVNLHIQLSVKAKKEVQIDDYNKYMGMLNDVVTSVDLQKNYTVSFPKLNTSFIIKIIAYVFLSD